MKKVNYRLPTEVVEGIQDSTGQGPGQPDLTRPALSKKLDQGSIALFPPQLHQCYQPFMTLEMAIFTETSSRPVLFTAILRGGTGHRFI